MKRVSGLSLLCCALAVTAAWAEPEQAAPDVVADYFRAGKLSLEAGVVASMYEYRDDAESGPGVVFGMLQLKYATPERAGLTFGGWALAAKEITENHDGNYDDLYSQDSDLRELYAKWKTPFTKSSIQAGRFGVKMSAMDGNSHQGVEVVNEDVHGLALRAAVINRWINNDRVDMYYKGITGWVDVDDVRDDTGHEFWLGSAKADVFGFGEITPFIGYQEKVMLLYGTDYELSHELSSGHTVGLDGTVAMYGNETPKEVADYDDVFSWLVHGTFTPKEDVTLGIGWYGVSDDKGDITAGIFDTFDPLEEDGTIPHDDQNNAQLYYADVDFSMGMLSLYLAYGYGINDAINVNSHEVDAVVTADVTKSVQASLFASFNDYSSGDEDVPDYTKMGASLTYSY